VEAAPVFAGVTGTVEMGGGFNIDEVFRYTVPCIVRDVACYVSPTEAGQLVARET
jgi:hypothetical protein